MKYSAYEKQREAERELGMRKRFYPDKVDAGALDPKQAQRRIEIMQEIAEEYAKQAAREAKRERLI